MTVVENLQTNPLGERRLLAEGASQIESKAIGIDSLTNQPVFCKTTDNESRRVRCEAIPRETGDTENSSKQIDETEQFSSVGTKFEESDTGTVKASHSVPEKIATPEDSAQSHSAIRSCIADTIFLPIIDSQIRSAIALACHPWPDVTVEPQVLASIASELLPSSNANHPSILEIAIDRLLRLSEAVAFENCKELANVYLEAAHQIGSFVASGPHSGMSKVQTRVLIESPIVSPWGIARTPLFPSMTVESHVSENHTALALGQDDRRWAAVISEMINASIVQGNDDIGKLCGGEEAEVSVAQFAHFLGIQLPVHEFDAYLLEMNSRARDILLSRSFKLTSNDTLVELAERWGITRERVRQIEFKVKERLHVAFSKPFLKFGYRTLLPLTSRIVRLDELFRFAFAIAGRSRFKECLAGFVLELFGPWKTIGSWAYHESLEDRLVGLRHRLSNCADPYGFIDASIIEDASHYLFKDDLDRNHFLTTELNLGFNFGYWTERNTIRCQVFAAIKKIGRPATKEEVSDLLGHPRNSIGSTFGNIPEIVRADRIRWGFREWIKDVYDGIVGEIEQRIEEYNGSVPFQVLLHEIPSQFNVAESSVKAYVYSDAFVVENDMVRLANTEDYCPRSPNGHPDTLKCDGRWGHRVRLYERHFNGYSLGVSFDVAFANGLRPGDDLVVPIEGTDYQASLIWRSYSTNRLVDVGRVTNFLTSSGFHANDCVVIIPSRTCVTILSESDVIAQFNIDLLENSKECPEANDEPGNDVHDPLIDLLGG